MTLISTYQGGRKSKFEEITSQSLPARAILRLPGLTAAHPGMHVREVLLSPGANQSHWKEPHRGGWAIDHYEVLPDRVLFYLWPEARGIQFEFAFRPRFDMTASTAPSLLYDFYNPEARAILRPVQFVVDVPDVLAESAAP